MISHEQYDALHRGSGLLERTDRGRLVLTGGDRRSYLHGLLTNDIVALSPGTGCYAALLTPQGRMISDMRVTDLGDRLLLDLPAATAESVRTRLADFVFAEDVEVNDASESLAQLAVYGPLAADVLLAVLTPPTSEEPGVTRDRLESLPPGGNERWAFAGSPIDLVRSDDYGIAGFELFLDAAGGAELVEACRRAGALPIGLDTAHVTRIEAGRPQFGIDMDESTIPLEAGIEDRAISLTKGCYVGQEIIIRVLHRGQGRVARRLVGLAADAQGEGLSRGARLHRDGRDVGQVTSAAQSPRLGRAIALGYVHRESAEPGTALTIPREGSAPLPVTVVPLPFTAPADR